MPQVNKSALLEFSAAQVYHLVNDVAAYPEFLPWCSGTEILLENATNMEARIEIAHGGIRKAFTTRNILHPVDCIELQLLDGPFKSLQGFWRFKALDDSACKVSLELNYEFASKLLALAVGPVFNKIANTLVDAFCARARDLYG